MKKYKVSVIIIVAMVVVISAVFFLKREKTESIFNDDIKHDLTVADFKKGEEYHFKGIPWGISQEKLDGMVPYSLFQFDYQVGDVIDLHSTEPYLFWGKTTDAIFRFREDKLTEVQLTFRRDENAVEQYDSIIAEANELFGAGKENEEGYFWQTDNTMLNIISYNVSGRKVMNIFISSLNENDLDGKVQDNEEIDNNEILNETENVENPEGLVEFKFADLKKDGEYQIDLLPLGTSWYKLKPWSVMDGYQILPSDEESEWSYTDVRKYVWSDNEYLLEGMRFNPVYEFLYDELIEVKLVPGSDENVAEQFEYFVAELTDLFGKESDRTEKSETDGLIYTWQTDHTRLQIHLEVLNEKAKNVTISVGYTEKERDRILAENVKEPKELVLTSFRQDQEYQFEEVAWKSSVEEVEVLLGANLKDVTREAPKDYVYYDSKNVVYVLDGHEAETSFEFQSEELVYLSFKFNELEDPKTFLREIVSVLQTQYGTENEIVENEERGIIGYRWKTENTLLAVGLYEEYGNEVVIFLASLK